MQITFVDAMKPTTFEKPHELFASFGKVFMGFAITTSIFCVDNLPSSTVTDVDVFAHLRYYIVEVAGVALLLVATFLSKTREEEWKITSAKGSHATVDKTAAVPDLAPSKKSAKQGDGLISLSTPPSAELGLHDVIDQNFIPLETEFHEFAFQALELMKSEVQERLLETLKPVKAELHSRIHNALHPEEDIEFDYWMGEGMTPTQALLQEMVGRALDPVELELEDMAEEACPTPAEIELREGADRTFGQPMELSEMLRCCAQEEAEAQLQGLIEAAQNSMEMELDSQFEQTIRHQNADCQSGIDAALHIMEPSNDDAFMPMFAPAVDEPEAL